MQKNVKPRPAPAAARERAEIKGSPEIAASADTAPQQAIDNALPIRLVVLDGLAAAPIADRLSTRMPGAPITVFDNLEEALGNEGPVLVVMADAVDSLGNGLASAESAQEALADWQATRRDVLAHQRRNRRRVTLINIALLANTESKAWGTLAQRCNRVLAESSDAAPAEAEMQFQVAPPFRLAAMALSLADAETVGMLSELDAVMLGRPEEAARSAVLAAVADLQARDQQLALLRENLDAHLLEQDAVGKERAERDRSAARIAASASAEATKARLAAEARDVELALLRENLGAQLLEQDAAGKAWAEQERSAARVAATASAAATSARLAAEARASEMAERMTLLEENLRLQAEQGAAQASEDNQALARQRDNLQASLDAARRASEEARQMVAVEQAAREGQARLAQERQQCRDSVLGARILTAAHTERQLGEALKAATHDLSQLRQAVTDLGNERDALAQNAAEQMQAINTLGAELDRVYGSRSWRVTGPLRAVMSRFGGSRP